MKSYILEHVHSVIEAERALDETLPGQRHPWVLWTAGNDAHAYFNVDDELDGEPNLCIIADISGRHYNDETPVVDALTKLQSKVGGEIAYSP